MTRIIALIFIIIIWVCSSCSSANDRTEVKNSNGWLYFIDNSDTLKAISVSDKKIIPIKYLPSSHGQHHVSPDGKNLIYGVKDKVNDSTYSYNIYILDLASGDIQLVSNGYGGAWSNNGKHFVVFMDDSLWLYEYPSLKKIKTFKYTAGWRLCSVAWTPSDKYIAVFAYDRTPDKDGAILAILHTKFLLFQSDSLNIFREEKMDSLFTKRFVAVDDKVFLCCAECMKKHQDSNDHLLKTDLSNINIFKHIPIRVNGVENIAINVNSRFIFYASSQKKGIVMAPLDYPDSSKIIIPSFVTLLGWSNNCFWEK